MTGLPQIIFLIFALLFSDISAQNNFKLGNEVLLSEKSDLLKNKKIALVVNKASVLRNGTPLADTLLALGFSVKKFFALEHGLKVNFAPGEKISDSETREIPVVSLYGKKKAPDSTDLRDIDAIVYDIQDAGTRFYTYISSLKLIAESAAKYGKEIIVLDRPNPQGDKIAGEILAPEFRSFVGAAEIPVLYGMTVGELARFFASRIPDVKLTVVPMKNFNRSEDYFFGGNAHLQWRAPSPNLRTPESAALYPALCFLEATNVSEGRGTDFPFEQFGAPFFDANAVIAKLDKTEFASHLDFAATVFTPKTKGFYRPKHARKKCFGVKIKIIDKNFDPVLFGAKLLKILSETYPKKIKFNFDWLAKLYGNRRLEKYLTGETTFEELENETRRDAETFEQTRRNFLIYGKNDDGE